MAVLSIVTPAEIVAHAHGLPAAPQVLGGLCELLEDVNTGLEQVAEEIRRDPALTARVIRLSNSVVFGGGGDVGSVEAAVTRVGFAAVVRLVGVATVSGLVERSLHAYGVGAEQLRESLLWHALASEALASRTGLNPRTAYTAGLLRGLGRMVLDRVIRSRVGVAEEFTAGGTATYSAWERARFGVTGMEAAMVILREWRFPSDFVAAIGHHEEPARAGAWANVLNLAGASAAAAGLGLPGEVACWGVTPERLAAAGLDEAQWHAAHSDAGREFEHQRSALY